MELNYYFSQTEDAYRNLALDEYFLTHLPADTLLLYFYVNDNAVIIGRNQNAFRECDLQAMQEHQVQLVRRITGGGAVMHDGGNLNFSFLSPKELYDTDAQDEILLTALRSLGIAAEKNGRNDFVALGRKFSGNAFGARGDNRVRHGTLLVSSDLRQLDRYLTVSAKKLQAKGVTSVRSRVCNLTEVCADGRVLTVPTVADAICRAFEAYYGATATPFALTSEEEAAVEALRAERSSFAWIMGEAPAFDYALEERLSFGMVQLYLSVTGGRIAEVRLYTDALDTTLPSRVEAVLMGLPFSPEAVCEALTQTEQPELTELGACVLAQL